MSDPISRLNSALEGQYRITSELGEGGMATVYLAEDLRHDRNVALKVLKPELAAALGPERFLREIQIAARLQHPHVLPLYDSGDAGGFLYYVMPFVEGESLRERLDREGELPVGDAVRILGDVVDALTEAHASGVVHRDIKPENVLLRGRHALVADFGVAKAVSEATGRQKLTTVGVSLGTPAYMAPEQAAADPHLDHRVDIYAVGVLGYELLAGRQPFDGTTPHQILAAHVTEVPRNVAEHRPSMPAALAGIIMRCLEKKPADRWQTASELLDQLEALQTPSGGMTPTGLQPVSSPPFQRWRYALAPAVVAAIALVFWWVTGSDRPETEGPVLAEVRQLTANPLETALSSAAISPDGTYLAYVDPTGLWVMTMSTREATRRDLPDSLTAWEVGWYPDGARLFFLGGTTRGRLDLYSLPLLGGDPALVSPSVLRAAAAPDGSGFAAIRASSEGGAQFKEIWTMGPRGEDARLFLEAGRRETFWNLAWSPDGARLAVGTESPDGAWLIRTVDRSGGSETILVQDPALFQNWTGVLPFVWCSDGRLVHARREGSNSSTSNVWTIETDPNRGIATGEPRRATQHIGSNVRKLTATMECESVVAMLVRNQADVWVAELEQGGTSLVEDLQVTVDERSDQVMDWMPDGALVIRSSRSGTGGFYRWLPGTAGVTPWVVGDQSVTNGEWAWSIDRFVYESGGVWTVGADGSGRTRVTDEGIGTLDCARSGACVTGHREGDDFVFSLFDAATGEVREASRIDFREPFTQFALSPDGGTAAVVHLNDNTVRLIEVASGEEDVVVVEGWSQFEFVEWSADGTLLFINAGYAASGSYPVLLAVERDGSAHVLRQRTNVWHVWPKASPDGRYLAFAAMPFQGNAYLLTNF